MKAGIPRRILMTADPIGGVWTFALELTRAFEPYGIDVVLATMGARLTSAQHRELARSKNLQVCESKYRLEWMENPWADVERAGEWLLELADRFRPDLVHLNGYSLAALPWRVPVLITAHSCVLSWWRAVKREEAPARFDEYRRRVGLGLAAADLLTAPSIAMRDSLSQNYRCACDCVVVYNGRDPRLFMPAAKSPSVFSCGRVWDEAKNLALLDEVALRCQWPIEIAGDCCHPEGGALGLHHVRCVGKIPSREIAERLGRSAIFVLPARYEPFGLSVLEAALSGCALLLTDIPSLREIWDDAALFVGTDDASGLADALERLICKPRLRTELSARARRRALEFSPAAMAAGYLAAYAQCAGTKLVEVAA